MNAANIERAIRDVMLGAHGLYATRMAGLFLHGTFEGQPEQAKAAYALKAKNGDGHGFDVELGPLVPHEASPAGVIGTYRLATMQVAVKVTTRLPPANDKDARVAIRAKVMTDMSLAVLALGEPEAVRLTAAGDPTGIVAGLLRSPDGTGYPDIGPGEFDWLLHLATHEIRARAIVQIDRP